MAMKERQLEDWICQNWELSPWGQLNEVLIGRQIRLKHGRCDLLAFHAYPHLIELKARKIREQDIGQILRYRHDVSKVPNALCLDNPYGYIKGGNEYEHQQFMRAWRLASQLPPTPEELRTRLPFQMTLVGISIDEKTHASADGAGIDISLWKESQGKVVFGHPSREWQSDQRWTYKNLEAWTERLNNTVIGFCMNHVYAQRYSVLQTLFGNEDTEVTLSISPSWVEYE